MEGSAAVCEHEDPWTTPFLVFCGTSQHILKRKLPLRYWEYLGLLTLVLFAFYTLLTPSPTSSYTQSIGYIGLAIEAVLPLPQILANQRAQSCKGFRVSVLANWLLGDALKMGFFFTVEEGKVPWAFKLCGIFQAFCDVGLGLQWWIYGDGRGVDGNGILEKDARLS